MPKVTFQNSGQTAEAKDNALLKDVTQENGWPIPYACENGICGTCLVRVEAGKENLNPIDEQEQMTLDAMGALDGNHRLACQCKLGGDITIAQ